MREIVKSFLQLSWATSLFGVRQLTNGSGVAESFDRIAAAASANLPGARPAAPPPNQPAPPRPQSPPQPAPSGRLNVARFVVLGEGLAAGMGNFTLASDSQHFSFPAQMARQMGAPLPQPLIEPPGTGDAIGFEKLPVIVPNPLQTTVLDRIPPERPATPSVPGFTVADALHLRPRQPLIDRHDSKQTCANLILGMHAFAYGTAGPMPTQLESALTRRTTFALIALGYAEALEAAASGALASLPARDAFRDDYRKIVHELRAAGAEVVAL